MFLALWRLLLMRCPLWLGYTTDSLSPRMLHRGLEICLSHSVTNSSRLEVLDEIPKLTIDAFNDAPTYVDHIIPGAVKLLSRPQLRSPISSATSASRSRIKRFWL
jgi:hypothetical protein